MSGSNDNQASTGSILLWAVASLMLFSTIWLSGIAPLQTSICANGDSAILGFEHSNAVRYLA